MGVFVGHDHDNDFIGIDKGIALGYGRVTGADAYGELTRGARIIELYEDQFKFAHGFPLLREGRLPTITLQV